MTTATTDQPVAPIARPDDFKHMAHLRRHFGKVADGIRSGQHKIGRSHYALPLMHGVIEAIACGYPRIAAIELGVGSGDGLLDLCAAANFLQRNSGIEIDVYGFDAATGLPPPADYRDHPELWAQGEFVMGDPNVMRSKLADPANLILGDVRDTIPAFAPRLKGPIGFVSVDLDFYSSTRGALALFTFEPERYLPAVPMYVDDADNLITFNDWCGVSLAIREFTESQAHRKIVKTPFNIPAEHGSFHVCHVLDHPIRNGVRRPRFPLHMHAM
jgi:hypothetical protein